MKPVEEPSFGELLSAIIERRRLKSDEQIARLAMARQSHSGRRINVQRKTINNWRNNRSTPRSLSDPQFRLVMAALEPTDDEWSALKATFSDGVRAVPQKSEDSPGSSGYAIPVRWALAGISALCIVALILVLAMPGGNERAVYLDEIPEGVLTLTDSGFIIPDSATQPVTAAQLSKLSKWELYVARNEIYARKGWRFVQQSSVCLQNHFDALAQSNAGGWYVPLAERAELTNLEAANAAAIRQHECTAQGGQLRCDGKLHMCQ